MTLSLRRKISLALVVQPCIQLPFLVPVRALSQAPPPRRFRDLSEPPLLAAHTYRCYVVACAHWPLNAWACPVFHLSSLARAPIPSPDDPASASSYLIGDQNSVEGPTRLSLTLGGYQLSAYRNTTTSITWQEPCDDGRNTCSQSGRLPSPHMKKKHFLSKAREECFTESPLRPSTDSTCPKAYRS